MPDDAPEATEPADPAAEVVPDLQALDGVASVDLAGGRHDGGPQGPLADVAALRLRLARLHGDDVGAELGELGQHELVQPLADGGKQNHGRNTDGDAQPG